jgi:hypothetical protein
VTAAKPAVTNYRGRFKVLKFAEINQLPLSGLSAEGRINIVDNALKHSPCSRSSEDRIVNVCRQRLDKAQGATRLRRQSLCHTEKGGKHMISSKKGSLTHLALITSVACLCLGSFYGFVTGPYCWHCRSASHISFFISTDGAPRWGCTQCDRCWRRDRIDIGPYRF